MVRKFLLLIVAAIASCPLVTAQNLQVSGTVVDEVGDPVSGATITIGAQAGAITNDAGQFTISAPANGTLHVSMIGYKPQDVNINGRTRINITMEEFLQAIDDVIVVAFGTATRESFTGSATVIKADELEKRQTTNVLDALVGSVPGMQMRGSTGQPGSSAGSINIRGINSMYSGTSPLVIVDGAPYTANLSNIPQSDIESVTVLKDAASAALYGARGATGVIIVTTKRARSREAVINVDMKWGVNSRALQRYDVITDPGEYYEAYYAQLYNMYYYRDGLSSSEANIAANGRMLEDLRYDVYTYPQGERLIGIDGKLNPNATLGREHEFNGTNYWVTPDDWDDEAFKTSLRHEYTVSVNGATDKSSYYTSFGYLNEGGIIDHSNYERFSARVRADHQAKKWLNVGANIGYTRSFQDQNSNWGTSSGAGNLFAFTSRIAPIYPLYVRVIDPDGNISIKIDEFGNKAYDFGVASTGFGLSRPFLGTGNPLGENQYNQYTVDVNQLNGTFTADIDITDFLKAKITSTVIWGHSYVSDFGNMFYGTPANTGGSIEKTSATGFRTNNIQSLTYYDSFDRHHVTAQIAHEYYNAQTKYLWARATGMFSPDVPEINAAATKATSSSYSTEYNVEGFLFDAHYDYDNKYYASLSFRREATSYFAPENRWGNFWSVGAAWILSKENFMSGAGWVDMLKLKASIGQQGNDDIGSYQYVDIFNIIDSGNGIQMSAVPSRLGNPDITWETTINFNTGVEFSLFRGRLTGGLDVYNKKTKNLLFWVSLPESSGYRGAYDNIGDIRNYGVEVYLTGALIRTKNVDWSISTNISHNRSRILSLPAEKIAENGGFNEHTNNVPMWYKVGGPLYNAYLPVYAGLDEQGKALFYMDILADDEKTVIGRTTTDQFNDATLYEHGSILPKVFGGFGTNLRVKDFDLSVTFDYQLGGKVYDFYYASVIGSSESASGAGSAIHKDWIRSWSPTNTGSDMPRWQYEDSYGAAASDRFLTNASYLNFQSFVVGYTVPSHLLKDKVKIRVYVAGENLWFWSARKGLDPRYTFTGNDLTGVLNYSPIRTISGGLQLTF